MKHLRFIFSLLFIFAITLTTNAQSTSEIKEMLEKKILVTKAEVNLLDKKVKAYSVDEDKVLLAQKKEDLKTLTKELKLVKELVKIEDKLDKLSKEKSECESKCNSLREQANAIYEKEK